MSTSPTPTATSSSFRSKKVLVPKVWKRPHSTIYGKNVEFGSSLYSDKIGELNGRKFNSELPWTMRNSGGSATSAGSSSYNQGYLSNLLLLDPYSSTFNYHDLLYSRDGSLSGNNSGDYDSAFKLALANCNNYSNLLELTNPNRYSKRNKTNCMQRNSRNKSMTNAASNTRDRLRIDFYDQYLNNNYFNSLDHLNDSSLLMNESILRGNELNHNLNFDRELGLFVSNHHHDNRSLKYYNDDEADRKCLITKKTLHPYPDMNINQSSFVPLSQITKQTKLLPKHKCQLSDSPYGQSADGRKLSLGSINPQSYRPSLPHKVTTAHASDGEEFEFQDRSSPFYTDR